jgi:hypothetical protein
MFKKIDKEKQKKATSKSTFSLAKFNEDDQIAAGPFDKKKGDKRKPNFDELQYICYGQAVNKAAAESLSIAFNQYPTIKNKATTGGIQISGLYVNENGDIEGTAIIERSSGDKHFDELFIKSTIETKYPPIPKHLGIKRYPLRGFVSL